MISSYQEIHSGASAMEWIKPLAAKIEKSETDTQPELELWPTGYERTSPLNHLLTTTHKPMQYFKQKNAFKEPCLWIISCNRIATETNAWKGNQVSWGMQLTEPLQPWHLTVGLPLQMLKATALRATVSLTAPPTVSTERTWVPARSWPGFLLASQTEIQNWIQAVHLKYVHFP